MPLPGVSGGVDAPLASPAQSAINFMSTTSSQNIADMMSFADDPALMPLRTLHAQLLSTISSFQTQTASILHDQERDLLCAFRARLQEIGRELDNEKKKNESGSAQWVARCKKLTEEVEWLREMTDRMTGENRQISKENRLMKKKVDGHEEDREFLLHQLVALKKENEKLKQKYEETKKKLEVYEKPSNTSTLDL